MVDTEGNKKYSYGSRTKYLSVLKGIFHYAVHDMEVLEKDLSDRLRVPVQDVIDIKTDTKYYTLADLNQLLDFMKTYKHQRFHEYQLYYVLMYFLSQTGLRISEALALRWIDIVDDKLTVKRQMSRNDKNEITITTLKNTSSCRTIRMNEELIRVLKKFKLKQKPALNLFHNVLAINR